MSKEKIKIEIPGIMTERGLALCDDDIDIYIRSLELFAANVPLALDKMAGLTKETLKVYAINVHGLKGVSEYIGAEETRVAAKHLEALAKAGDYSGVLSLNEDFIKKTEIIVENIQNWLRKRNS